VLVAAGVWVSRRVRRAGDFFVAGRALPGGLVFVTLLAANVGAGSTVGATGLAYQHGLSAWWWSGSAAIGCLVLGLVVAPRMHRIAAERGLLTVGDFLEARFDRSVRGLVASALWVGTLAILAGQIMAMAWALEVVLGLPKAWGCVLSGAILVAYFSGGGLLASVWVNVLELAVLVVGFVLAVPYATRAAGGWAAMTAAAGPAAAPDYGSLTGMGWPAILGLLVIFVPSFIVSPGLIQKTFGARGAAGARAAALGNAAALAVFAFIPAVLGMAARALRPRLANPELALPSLMTIPEALPPWLGGLALAALFAAEISTADAVLFMLSTSLSQDLYKAFLDPAADDRRLLRVSRVTSVAAGLLGVGLAIVLPTVVEALKTFYGILTATLFVPLLAGLLSSRPTARHARAGVVVSLAVLLGVRAALSGSPLASWAPFAAAIVAAAAVMAVGGLTARRRAT
jgi:SSS family solute:Na+ symporter